MLRCHASILISLYSDWFYGGYANRCLMKWTNDPQPIGHLRANRNRSLRVNNIPLYWSVLEHYVNLLGMYSVQFYHMIDWTWKPTGLKKICIQLHLPLKPYIQINGLPGHMVIPQSCLKITSTKGKKHLHWQCAAMATRFTVQPMTTFFQNVFFTIPYRFLRCTPTSNIPCFNHSIVIKWPYLSTCWPLCFA